MVIYYHDAITILEAYRQLEHGHRVSQLKSAAKRVRALDPANELLPELEWKIAQLTGCGFRLAENIDGKVN